MDRIIGTSRRGGMTILRVAAAAAPTTRAAPPVRNDAIQIGVMERSPVVMIGQLRPSTTTA